MWDMCRCRLITSAWGTVSQERNHLRVLTSELLVPPFICSPLLPLVLSDPWLIPVPVFLTFLVLDFFFSRCLLVRLLMASFSFIPPFLCPPATRWLSLTHLLVRLPSLFVHFRPFGIPYLPDALYLHANIATPHDGRVPYPRFACACCAQCTPCGDACRLVCHAHWLWCGKHAGRRGRYYELTSGELSFPFEVLYACPI